MSDMYFRGTYHSIPSGGTITLKGFTPYYSREKYKPMVAKRTLKRRINNLRCIFYRLCLSNKNDVFFAQRCTECKNLSNDFLFISKTQFIADKSTKEGPKLT